MVSAIEGLHCGWTSLLCPYINLTLMVIHSSVYATTYVDFVRLVDTGFQQRTTVRASMHAMILLNSQKKIVYKIDLVHVLTILHTVLE